MQGRVKLILRQKGYGFIWTEAGDFLFHFSEVLGSVSPGDAVDFWLDDAPRFWRREALVAVEVRRIESEEP
jgi:cold shock CspA family protein